MKEKLMEILRNKTTDLTGGKIQKIVKENNMEEFEKYVAIDAAESRLTINDMLARGYIIKEKTHEYRSGDFLIIEKFELLTDGEIYSNGIYRNSYSRHALGSYNTGVEKVDVSGLKYEKEERYVGDGSFSENFGRNI